MNARIVNIQYSILFDIILLLIRVDHESQHLQFIKLILNHWFILLRNVRQMCHVELRFAVQSPFCLIFVLHICGHMFVTWHIVQITITIHHCLFNFICQNEPLQRKRSQFDTIARQINVMFAPVARITMSMIPFEYDLLNLLAMYHTVWLYGVWYDK